MSRITSIDPNQAQGKASELLAAVNKLLGGTPNMFRTAAHSPAALESLIALFGTTAHGKLTAKVRESIALAVSEVNGCDYCLSAHSAFGQTVGLDREEIKLAREASAPDAKTHAILQFAKALVLARGQVGGSALTSLRNAGVSDAETLEVITNVAVSIFTNYMNIVADTDIDFPVVRARDLPPKAA